MPNSTGSGVEISGWTPGPDGRGTLDIIWTSVVTMFLCSWTVLCLNLPPDFFTDRMWVRQKLLMTGLVFIGPEFLFQLALGQWLSAHNSVRQFRSSGLDNWTMKHAFFADMGGYVFDDPEEMARFPLTAKQVYYLVHKGYVGVDDAVVQPKVIADRNKGDGVTRLITCCQIFWFFLNTAGRMAQGLAITTLELTTLATIFCTLATYTAWMHKPLDVKTAVPLKPKKPLRLILDDAIVAGEYSGEPYRRTPLDFIEAAPSSWYIYWSYGMDVFRRMHIHFWRAKARPAVKIAEDHFLPLSGRLNLLLFAFQLAFTAIHLAGWNFFFPTPAERVLWHVSSAISVACVFVYWAVDLFAFDVLPWVYGTFPSVARCRHALGLSVEKHAPGSMHERCHATAARLRNLSEGRDPQFAVPLKAIAPVAVLVTAYCATRAIVLIECFIGLRLLPVTAYKTVRWASFVPHF